MRFPSRLDAFSISFRSTRSYNPFPVWFSTNDVSVGRQHGCLLAVCRLYQSQLVPTRLRFQVFYGAGQLYRANLTESSKALSFRCFVQTVDTSQIRYRPQNDSVESPPHSPIYDGRRLNSRRYIYIYIVQLDRADRISYWTWWDGRTNFVLQNRNLQGSKGIPALY